MILCSVAGLFLGGLGMRAYQGRTGAVSGTISTSDFDSASGIRIDAGSLQISATEFIMGLPGSQAIYQGGGALTISSSLFAGPPSKTALILITGGSMTISSTRFDSASADVTSIEEQSENTMLTLNASLFIRTPNTVFQRPTILLGGGRSVIMGNVASDKGTGSGAFVSIKNDNSFNRVIGNVSPGWPSYAPSGRKGTYLFN